MYKNKVYDVKEIVAIINMRKEKITREDFLFKMKTLLKIAKGRKKVKRIGKIELDDYISLDYIPDECMVIMNYQGLRIPFGFNRDFVSSDNEEEILYQIALTLDVEEFKTQGKKAVEYK